jgi:hypothetical protein
MLQIANSELSLNLEHTYLIFLTYLQFNFSEELQFILKSVLKDLVVFKERKCSPALNFKKYILKPYKGL